MAILTEDAVRKLIKTTDIKETKVFEMTQGTIITPAARSFLSDHQIKLKVIAVAALEAEPVLKEQPAPLAENVAFDHGQPLVYQTLEGGQFSEKPVFMSFLDERTIVPKNHPQLLFRWQLEGIYSEVVELQRLAVQQDCQELLADVAQMAKLVQHLMANGEQPPALLTSEKVAVPHFMIDYKMKEATLKLNKLRLSFEQATARAYDLFRASDGTVTQVEVFILLDELIKFCWRLMLKSEEGKYKCHEEE